jgi:hypothetical protein
VCYRYHGGVEKSGTQFSARTHDAGTHVEARFLLLRARGLGGVIEMRLENKALRDAYRIMQYVIAIVRELPSTDYGEA